MKKYIQEQTEADRIEGSEPLLTGGQVTMDRLHPAFRRNHKNAPEGLLKTTSRSDGDNFLTLRLASVSLEETR